MASVLESCTYFVSNRLARETEKIAKKVYQPTGMNPTYSYVLMAIDEKKTVLLHDLADLMDYSPSTMSRFVDSLVKKGYVARDYQWRKVALSLTDSGKQMVKIAYQCLAKMDQETCRVFGSAEQRDRVVANLNEWTTTIEATVK
ncbi:MarR family winged helix-turn-helix transcriptional regulator [Pediococcus inopinatus]|uniref:MarR family winged helix-turn-helix transcriptional regulator n=1 Tax=Pediococcus inopinatus TaxID=114090 RepID=UPI00070D8BD1|nr:MarR family transcriptional regulator [Pediococcus inopinatus]AVK99386.1 MarR family transcriptional regulator [Pediococcus inopinatus]